MQPQEHLQIAVVGAGIAGLSAAIALRRAGHHVEVFEKSRFSNETGAAITVGPNATRVFDRWGFDCEKYGAVENKQIRMPKGDTMEVDWQDLFGGVPEKYGSRWLFFHRADLHGGLREMAEDPDTRRGMPVKLNLGSEVVEIDPDSGQIKTRDGRGIPKDLVVITDGSHTQFITTITGEDVPVKNSGRSVFRCMIPMDEVMRDEETRPLFENEPQGLFGPHLPSKGVICSMYGCKRNGKEVLSCGALHATKPEEMDKDDWNNPATLEQVMETVKDFHPMLKALYRKATEIKVYNLKLRDPLERYVKGKAVLIGDACHPMLPYHAQGASMSIESTAALQVLFTGCTKDQVEDRLQVFQKLRLPRCATTQLMSNMPGPPLYPKMVERVKKFYTGPLPPPTAKPWSEPLRDFFFSYDVFEESRMALEDAANDKSRTHQV